MTVVEAGKGLLEAVLPFLSGSTEISRGVAVTSSATRVNTSRWTPHGFFTLFDFPPLLNRRAQFYWRAFY